MSSPLFRAPEIQYVDTDRSYVPDDDWDDDGPADVHTAPTVAAIRMDLETLTTVAEVERHLREVELAVEQLDGTERGSSSRREITPMQAYRRLVRSRRAELLDTTRREGSSARQRALRQLAKKHPEEYMQLLRAEQQAEGRTGDTAGG